MAANGRCFKRFVNHFLQFNLDPVDRDPKATKHQGKCLAFFYFVPLLLEANPFSSEAEKKSYCHLQPVLTFLEELKIFLRVPRNNTKAMEKQLIYLTSIFRKKDFPSIPVNFTQ